VFFKRKKKLRKGLIYVYPCNISDFRFVPVKNLFIFQKSKQIFYRDKPEIVNITWGKHVLKLKKMEPDVFQKTDPGSTGLPVYGGSNRFSRFFIGSI
jgi:hypothetical protein